MSIDLRFDKGDTREALFKWWLGLSHHKGDRASLRRCDELVEVIAIPVFHDLCARLLNDGSLDARSRYDATQRLCAVAALVGRIRPPQNAGDAETPKDPEPDAQDKRRLPSLPLCMAGCRSPSERGQMDSDKALVSQLRFRRLIQAETQEDFFHQMRRILRLLPDDRIDIAELADAAYHWGPRLKTRWAYDYFGAFKSAA